MTNKEKFLALVAQSDHSTLEQVQWRIKNREMLRESQKIALKILTRLDELVWTQKDLAREMGVSPQQVNKIVSGKENLGLETQIKLQRILDIPILASYYEDRMKKHAVISTVTGGEAVQYEFVDPVPQKRSPESTETGTLKVVYNTYGNVKAAS